MVQRANVFEDNMLKIDFKVRTPVYVRGVGVGDEEKISMIIKKIGLQFTIRRNTRIKKAQLLSVKEHWKGKLPVDDIVLIHIHTREFEEAYAQWLKAGKPSGGPEQFLSEELKKQLLDLVLEGLLEKNNVLE